MHDVKKTPALPYLLTYHKCLLHLFADVTTGKCKYAYIMIHVGKCVTYHFSMPVNVVVNIVGHVNTRSEICPVLVTVYNIATRNSC